MNFDKESKSEKKKLLFFFLFFFFFFAFAREGGGKTVYQTVSDELKYKKKLSSQCKACGIINILKYVNNFLSTNITTLILSSLVSEF